MVFRNVMIFYLYVYFYNFLTKADIPIQNTPNSTVKKIVARLQHIVQLAEVMFHNNESQIWARQQESISRADKIKGNMETGLQSAEKNNKTQQDNLIMRINEQRNNITIQDAFKINVTIQKDQNKTVQKFMNKKTKKTVQTQLFTTNKMTSQRREIFDFTKTYLWRQKRSADGYTEPTVTHTRFEPVRYRSNDDVSYGSNEFFDNAILHYDKTMATKRQKIERSMPSSGLSRAREDQKHISRKEFPNIGQKFRSPKPISGLTKANDSQKIHFRAFGQRDQDRATSIPSSGLTKADDDKSYGSIEFPNSGQEFESPRPSSRSTKADDGKKIHFRAFGQRDEDRARAKEEFKKHNKLHNHKGFNFYGKNYEKKVYDYNIWKYVYLYGSEYVEYDLDFPMAKYVPKVWKERVPHLHGPRILSKQLFTNILKAMAQVGGSTFTRGPRNWFGTFDYMGPPAQ